MLSLPSISSLMWLDAAGDASTDGESLTMRAQRTTDWFNDPTSQIREASAGVLVFPADGDFQLAATVTVRFAATFDAGVLFVHQSGDDWAKLCFERSPTGEPTVVSVVTRGVSDDANGPGVVGASVHLRISRVGPAFAFHYAHLDDAGTTSHDDVTWHLLRLFALRDPEMAVHVGFLSQSPTGDGCTTRFDDVRFSQTTLGDPRDGS